MAKRDTVNVDCDKIDILRKANEWNQSAFSRKVGKYSSWYSEVLRGNNLPSPEEAARMCILLKTTPDDILLHEGGTPEETAKCLEDIETVRKLVEAERAKEAPATEGEGLDAARQKLYDAIANLTDEQCTKLLGVVEWAKENK